MENDTVPGGYPEVEFDVSGAASGTMRAALLLAPRTVQIREVEIPPLAATEVRIRPLQVGICGSDTSFFLGHRPVAYPFVLGHEMVGRILEIGSSVTRLTVGQRVVVEPNYPCGGCNFCREGRGAICPHKKSFGVSVPGCLAELTSAPAEFVWPVPDSITNPMQRP